MSKVAKLFCYVYGKPIWPYASVFDEKNGVSMSLSKNAKTGLSPFQIDRIFLFRTCHPFSPGSKIT